MSAREQGFSRLPSREWVVTLGGLAVIILLSWWYLFDMAAGMKMMAMGEVMAFKAWTASYFFMMCTMWAIMMVAMMLPSATPMILLYRQVATRHHRPGASVGVFVFAGGYVAVWAAFSMLATELQWALEQGALLSPMMRSQNAIFSGAVLLAAGLYQWSPWKQACLRQCQGPVFFITQHWRPGLGGAFRMGALHGAYCVGCCGLLMALLFVGGVMDLTVIALISVVVLLEKVLRGGERLAKGLGVMSMAVGAVILLSSL